eukprot:jgi/Picsp_1/2231/NSC_05695-R1_---NA---
MGPATREVEEVLSVNAKPFQPSSAQKGTPLVVHVGCGNENGACDTPCRSQHVDTPVHQRVRGQKASQGMGPRTRMVLESLDQIPFTPSQGICTPSPTNMATANVLAVTHGSGGHPNIMAAGSPNHLHAQAHYYVGNENMVPISPGLIQAVYYAHPAACRSPVAPRAGESSNFHAGSPSSPMGVYVGSPSMGAPESQGRRVFDRYLAKEGHPVAPPPCKGDENQDETGQPSRMGPEMVHQETQKEMTGGTQENTENHNQRHKVERNQSKLLGSVDLDVAMDLALHICAIEGVQVMGDIPHELLDLASLLITLDIPIEMATFPAAQFGSPIKGNRKDLTVKVDKVRLNARQRRTLRRAQERAWQALEKMREGMPSENMSQHSPTVAYCVPNALYHSMHGFETDSFGGYGVTQTYAEYQSCLMVQPQSLMAPVPYVGMSSPTKYYQVIENPVEQYIAVPTSPYTVQYANGPMHPQTAEAKTQRPRTHQKHVSSKRLSRFAPST